MTWTKRGGYRHPPCVTCRVAVDMGIRSMVKAGRCHIGGIGDVCSYHFHVLMEAFSGG